MQLWLVHTGVLAAALPLPAGRRPPSCTWTLAADVLALLANRQLGAAFESYIHAAGGAPMAAAIAAAAQLLQQVPLEQPPPGISREQHAVFLVAVAEHVARLCSVAGSDFSGSAVWQRLDARQRQRVVAQLLPAVTRLPQLLGCISGGQQAAELPERRRFFLQAMLGGAFIQILILNKAASDEASFAANSGQAAARAGSTTDAAAWCGAACAVLQCIPIAEQLAGMGELADVPGHFVGAALPLAWAALHHLSTGGRPGTDSRGSWSAGGDSLRFVAAWQLHSWLARLVHFSAAAGDVSLVQLGGRQQAGQLLQLLSNCMAEAAQLCSTWSSGAAQEPSAPNPRQAGPPAAVQLGA